MKYTDIDLTGKNILITGGAGFIGSNLAMYFQENHPGVFVCVYDKFRSNETFSNGNPTSLGHFKNLIGFKGKIICGDMLDLSQSKTKSVYLDSFQQTFHGQISSIKNDFINAVKWDYIFHQAAISDTTCMDQNLVMKTNYETFKFFWELAYNCEAALIYASSAGVYGNTPAPNKVYHNEIPENVYGFSKLRMDIENFGLSLMCIGLRYFNVYGGREFYKGKTASMILQLGIQALNNGTVKLFKHGEQKRDFVYIEDVIQANVKAMERLHNIKKGIDNDETEEKSEKFSKMNPVEKLVEADLGYPTIKAQKEERMKKRAETGGIYNVGTGIARDYNDIIKCLKDGLGDFKVEYIDNPYKFFQNHTEADISSTIDDLGYKPRYSLEQGIAEYIEEIKHRAKESL